MQHLHNARYVINKRVCRLLPYLINIMNFFDPVVGEEVLSRHEHIPDVSFSRVDIEDSAHTFILPRRELTRLHGKLH